MASHIKPSQELAVLNFFYHNQKPAVETAGKKQNYTQVNKFKV